MPYLYQQAYDDDGPHTGPGSGPGGPGAPPGGPPPPGAEWGLTRRWIDVGWTFTEPEPAGACTGFDVAIFAGPDVDGGALAVPIEAIDDPAARRHVTPLELRSAIDLRAAVRARYGAFRSAWREASAAAPFVPDAQPRGEESGLVRLPDGTVMQWLTSAPLHAQGAYDLPWPAPFPRECYCAAAAAVIAEGGAEGNDNWLQIIARDAAGIRLYKQDSGTGAGDVPVRAHVVAWGR